MNETTISSKITNRLKKLGYIVIRLRSTGDSGWPDLMVLKDGHVDFIEVKTPTGKLSKIQEERRKQLQEAGFRCMVIHSTNQLKHYGLE